MFDSLGQRLNAIFLKLKRQGTLSEKQLDEGLREVRRALLEADVNYQVVKQFSAQVRQAALGQQVLSSLTPGQQVIKIVRNELTVLLGNQRKALDLSEHPTVLLLVGLQGSGKTTTAAKLARQFKGEGRKVLLAASDVQRPAAIEQLRQLGAQLDLPVSASGHTPLEITRNALEEARRSAQDILIIDTAGRLQIDEALMEELLRMKTALAPREILLVADAMTGQEAVNIAQAFHERLKLTGIILTKLDGDARGGAALSMAQVTGVPIVFSGVGEKLADLEPFYPDRLAQRILGMGDVLSLIEQAEKVIDTKQAEALAQKIQSESFTLQDFKEQLEQVRSLGPINKLLEKLPGLGGMRPAQAQVDERELTRVTAIINSMTSQERAQPEILNGKRKKRIARGSGSQVSDVNRLLKRFAEAKRMMKQLSKMGSLGPFGR
ncbi:MAG TPA: signal recognition particle protein [Candidatus Fraserbacteria bacterium]|nr:signal recognition particle protein [Candidatus Fraserbacteria bacterium]